MARKGYQGESPSDRSINIMDKFIRKNEQRKNREVTKSNEPKPMNQWSLKEQLEFWDNITPEQRFDLDWTSYSVWIKEIQRLTGCFNPTFTDLALKHKNEFTKLFDSKISPKDALRKLRTDKIIWI